VEERMRTHPKLMDAYNILREYNFFFEHFEKIYKPHGRLFSSIESKSRPILYRYQERIKNSYSIPKESKYVLFMPELDIKGRNSPTVSTWLEKINKNQKISREAIHVIFYSKFFGVIPLGLSDTFPMGQYESPLLKGTSDLLYKNIASLIINVINTKTNNYEKCAFLIPNAFINQYNERVQFDKNPINKIFDTINTNINIPIIKADNIKEILEWF
jgi:7-cyano-7-deazaguanine tRNA-ribosyltransferase